MAEWMHHNYEVNEWSIETPYYTAKITMQGDAYVWEARARLCSGAPQESTETGWSDTMERSKREAAQAGVVLWLREFIHDRSSISPEYAAPMVAALESLSDG